MQQVVDIIFLVRKTVIAKYRMAVKREKGARVSFTSLIAHFPLFSTHVAFGKSTLQKMVEMPDLLAVYSSWETLG